MEKRSNYERKSKRVKVSSEPNPVEEAEALLELEEKAPETVRLVLLKQLKLNYTGSVSGKKYTFSGSGAELPINAEDVEIMMKKYGGKCCEGSGVGPQPYFAIV